MWLCYSYCDSSESFDLSRLISKWWITTLSLSTPLDWGLTAVINNSCCYGSWQKWFISQHSCSYCFKWICEGVYFYPQHHPVAKRALAATLFVPVYQPAGLRLASSDRSRWKEKLPVVEMLLCVSLIKMGLIVWELVHALWRSHGRTTWSNTEFHVFVSLLCRTLENCKWCFLNLNKWQWLRFRLWKIF